MVWASLQASLLEETTMDSTIENSSSAPGLMAADQQAAEAQPQPEPV
jgi:hypothetical protein